MIRALSFLVVAAFAAASAAPATAQTPAKPETSAPAKPEASTPAKPDAAAAPKPAAKKPATVAPKRFASADAAAEALVAALRTNDTKALLAILGSEGRPLLSSGDAVVDRGNRMTFVNAYDAAHTLVPNGNTMQLQVGEDDWPLPIPIVKTGEQWRFDARQGRDEILARRIGRNEIYTMQTCLAYVDAQREYYAADPNGDGILEYAQKFGSTPGKRDGLYWQTKEGEPPSPLGGLVTRARAEGYRKGEGPTPYHGYIYRILTAQGPAAPGGAYDYITRGHMIAGFALVAFPAQYGSSGVMTFLVNHDGVVYQKDLGRNTRAVATAMKTFNPDGTWTKAEVPELTASK
jgi:hypothetical protein